MTRWLWIFVLVVSGGAFMFLAGSNYLKFRKIENNGKTAMVLPFEKYVMTTHTTKKLGMTISEDKTFRADISFKGENNQVYTLPSREIPEKEMEQFQRGEQVSIKYLPNDPYEMNKFPSEDGSVTFFFLFGIALLGVAYWMIRHKGEGGDADEVRI